MVNAINRCFANILNMNIQEAVVSRIVELQKQKHLSTNKVAENCFSSTSTISSVLNGDSKNTQIKTIAKICYGLGVTIKEFINSPLFDDIDYIEDK